jgi:hypothetical protein
VSIVQVQLPWAFTAPTRPSNARNPNDPAYGWSSDLDSIVAQAQQYHMRVLMQVIGAPGWANGGRPWNWTPLRTKDYTDFLVAAAHRWPSVHLWMIWGEPNRQPNFQPMTPVTNLATRHLNAAQKRAPHHYAQILDASYKALKKLSKQNLVIGGNSYTTGDHVSIPPYLWVKNLRLPNGKPPHMDLYGHNPFSLRAPNLSNPQSPNQEVDFSDVGRLSRLVDKNLAKRHHHLKLFLSEWVIPTAPGDTEFGFWVDPSVAARWITDAWDIVNGHSFIYALGYIHLYDDATSTGGLIDAQGNPKLTYYAYQSG